ncbi:MAG: hypothetical protein WCG75_05450, partial [Armatimonadota bacterium]
MSKKTGIILAVILFVALLCCSGTFLFMKNVMTKVNEAVVSDQKFVATVLKATASKWDESAFSPYADDSFNTPEKREETRKQFETLNKNLGPLVSLGEVVQDMKALRANNTGIEKGFFVSFTAKAKFAKGTG